MTKKLLIFLVTLFGIANLVFCKEVCYGDLGLVLDLFLDNMSK